MPADGQLPLLPIPPRTRCGCRIPGRDRGRDRGPDRDPAPDRPSHRDARPARAPGTGPPPGDVALTGAGALVYPRDGSSSGHEIPPDRTAEARGGQHRSPKPGPAPDCGADRRLGRRDAADSREPGHPGGARGAGCLDRAGGAGGPADRPDGEASPRRRIGSGHGQQAPHPSPGSRGAPGGGGDRPRTACGSSAAGPRDPRARGSLVGLERPPQGGGTGGGRGRLDPARARGAYGRLRRRSPGPRGIRPGAQPRPDHRTRDAGRRRPARRRRHRHPDRAGRSRERAGRSGGHRGLRPRPVHAVRCVPRKLSRHQRDRRGGRAGLGATLLPGGARGGLRRDGTGWVRRPLAGGPITRVDRSIRDARPSRWDRPPGGCAAAPCPPGSWGARPGTRSRTGPCTSSCWPGTTRAGPPR